MNPIKQLFLNDKNILVLILLNAFVIFLQAFPVEELGSLMHRTAMGIDDFITFLFLVEVVVKVQHLGFTKYIASNWNRFDFLLILISLPPLLIHFLPLHTMDIGFLLVFRILRIFKFFRFIYFFPQVEHIFRSIQEALKASFMVLVGFFVFIFVISILSCFFYQDIAPEYFDNPINSYYSIFKIFTVEGWNAIPDDIINHHQLSGPSVFFTRLYFMFILIVGGIFGLSIVNSIFVDAMVSDNNDDLEKQVDKIEKDILDLKKDIEEIKQLLKR